MTWGCTRRSSPLAIASTPTPPSACSCFEAPREGVRFGHRHHTVPEFSRSRGRLKYEERLDRVLDRLDRVTKPTIAQVQGVAAGGGCAIALTCDLRVATPESTFGIPIARTLATACRRDLRAPGGSRGPGMVKDLVFTARLVPAAEALSCGMVNRVVSAGDIERSVREMAAEIAANAPLTLRATKELLRRLAAKRRLAAGDDADLVEIATRATTSARG